MLSFAQNYEQCRTAFLRETEYKNVEGLRDDLYYACILFGTGTPEYRAVGNAVLENANWHACPYSGLPAVQLLTEHGDMLSAGAREKLLSFLRQGQAGWCAELKKSKWNSFALLAAVSVLGYGAVSGENNGAPLASSALTALGRRTREQSLPDEFLSPFYTALQLAALAELQTLPLEEECRKAAAYLERFTWSGVLRHCQPGLLELTGVYSRGYTSELCGHFQAVLACVRRLLDSEAWFTFQDTLWDSRYAGTIVPHGSLDGMRMYALYFSSFAYRCAPEDLSAWRRGRLPRRFAEHAQTDGSWDVSCKKDVGEDVQCDYSPGKVTLVTEQEEGLVLSWLDREFENGMACPALRVLYQKSGDTKAFFTKLVRDESRYIGELNDYPNLGLRLGAANFPDDGRKTVREEAGGLLLTYRPRGFCRGAAAMKLDLIFTEHFSRVDGVWVNGQRLGQFDGKEHYALGPVTVHDGNWAFTFAPRGSGGYWRFTERNHFLNAEWVQSSDDFDSLVWELAFRKERLAHPSGGVEKRRLSR